MRKTHFVLSAAVAALSLGGARAALAQDLEPPTGRQGYYVGGGLFGANTTSRDDGHTYGPWAGNGFSIRFGQLVTRRFGLGLQIDGGGTTKGKESASFFGLNMEAQWTLWRTLAIKGGPGIGAVQLKDSRVEDEEIRGAAGAQYTLGISYDFFPWRNRLTGGWAVTPSLQTRFLPNGKDYAFVTLVGVEILWWSGLPRDQLALPDNEAYKRR